MQQNVLKLIALDLDGTLLMKGREIHPKAVEAIHRHGTFGMLFAVATGRDLDFIQRVLLDHNLGPQKNRSTWALIAQERYVYFWSDGGIRPLQEWDDRIGRLEGAMLQPSRRLIDETWPRLVSEDEKVERRVHREDSADGFVELGFSTREGARRAGALLSLPVQARLPAMRLVRNGRGVSVRHALASKGCSLRQAIDHLGIRASEVLAIGDAPNDLSMLDGSEGFECASVANADPAIREAVLSQGGMISLKESSEGVADILNRLDATEKEWRRRLAT